MRSILPAVLLCLVVGCSNGDSSGWYIDSGYSVALITFNEEHPVFRIKDPAATVEVIQIFRSDRGNEALTRVSAIRSKLLVYETRKRDEINSFFRATRIQSSERCAEVEGDYVFSILAFDPSLIRVGYIRYFPCRRPDIGWFMTYGSNSIYSSSETAKLINSIIPRSLQIKSR